MGGGVDSRAVGRKPGRRFVQVLIILFLVAVAAALWALWSAQYRPPQDGWLWDAHTPSPVADNLDWQAVGGNVGQGKFSPVAQISPNNVGRLQLAWTYRTGEVARRGDH